jgi:hypothetical protein
MRVAAETADLKIEVAGIERIAERRGRASLNKARRRDRGKVRPVGMVEGRPAGPLLSRARHCPVAWVVLRRAGPSIPSQEFERKWNDAGEQLRMILRRGDDVLAHCRGGLGRAGTIAARLLIELGMEPETAIARVRGVRPSTRWSKNLLAWSI